MIEREIVFVITRRDLIIGYLALKMSHALVYNFVSYDFIINVQKLLINMLLIYITFELFLT